MTDSSPSTRIARRGALRDAVFNTRQDRQSRPTTTTGGSAVCGVILAVTQSAIMLQTAAGEERVALSPDTVAWRGSAVPPSALRADDRAVIRRTWSAGDDRCTAARVWARIGRVSGAIVATEGTEILVDTGQRDLNHQVVVIDPAALRQVQVRFPRLAPGYLIDVIGVRRSGYLLAVAPATAQPPYLAGQPPAPPPADGHVAVPVTGTAVWHEPTAEPASLLGIGYPALDPETECGQCSHPVPGPGCVRLPYLSIGSAVWLRNDCTDQAAVLPVTSCAATARQFCDRCVKCGTSPRGRLADLTMATFVELGGNLEDACFNATLAVAI
jgi:hypothetical protein